MKLKKQSIIAVILTLLAIASTAPAQVKLDGTLGTAGKLELNGPDYDIWSEYGQLSGTNLFHSFQQFNINTDESATFRGPGSVKNIISRVTGGDSSRINGTLRSTIPDAALYLLNPSGVMFGPGASLDISGSFHVSTADYLRMGENEKFFSTPQESETLSISSPTAFGFLNDAAEPIVFDTCVIKSPLNEFSVISGNIEIKNNAQIGITSSGGRVDMASVKSAGEVKPVKSEKPDESGLDVSDFTEMDNIEISGESRVSVRFGSIFIRAGRFVADDSEIIATADLSFKDILPIRLMESNLF